MVHGWLPTFLAAIFTAFIFKLIFFSVEMLDIEIEDRILQVEKFRKNVENKRK